MANFGPPWTKEEIALLRADHAAGARRKDTASKLPGRSARAVYLQVMRLNLGRLPVGSKGKGLSVGRAAEARRLIQAEGWSYRRVAAHFGVAVSAVHTTVKRLDKREAQPPRSRLTPWQREVFKAVYGEGMTFREVAEAAGRTAGSAQAAYRAAMAKQMKAEESADV